MSTIDLLDLLVGTIVRGGLILALGWLGTRLLRRRSAASRHAVWLASFVGLLLLPALTLSLPVLEPPTLGSSHLPSITMAAGPHAATGSMTLAPSFSLDAPGRPAAIPSAGPGPGASSLAERMRPLARWTAPWLIGLWLIGAIVVLARLGRDVRRIASVTRRAASPQRGSLADLAQEVALDLRVRPPVRIAITLELALPVTWGFRHPVVLLPAAARRWDAERRRVVLRHELAHVRRGDYAGHLLLELVCALHWPNPFVWRAARRARLEQEQACDDRVLALGTGPIAYAQQLLDIARTFVSPAASTVPHRAGLAMAAAATLPERMRAILDVGLDHRPVGRRMLLGVACAATLVGLPTAALHPWTVGPREAELIARLDDADPLVRREAVWSLAARGSGPARQALVARLSDPDPATRGLAAWGLGKLGDRAATAPLLATLRDGDAAVREMAVLALGELQDPGAVPALERLAADPEHGVRSVMTVALRQIGSADAAAALVRLLRTDPDPHTRGMAITALSRFDTPGGAAALEAALGDSSADVRAGAARGFEHVGSGPSVKPLLVALAHEPDIDARHAMIRALGASRQSAAVDGLVGELGDSVPELRESAAQMLGVLGDKGAVEPLVLATRDPDHEVRLTAVWALDALQGR